MVGTNKGALYSLIVADTATADVGARKIFGGRISAKIRNGKIYVVTLQNLTYKDSNYFQLQVQTSRGDSSVVTSQPKSEIIELIVLGMSLMIICCSFS